MQLDDKIRILADAAKYDVSCSSSGSTRKNSHGLGNAAKSGICHSFTPDGRCISLLKILLTNHCVYDCTYCANRRTNDIERAEFTPDEIATITTNFYKRNYIEGLFLSSGILKNADYTMELLYNTLFLLRNSYGFNGYIHVKAIPGADLELIKRAGQLADRMSVNIELPSSESLKLLAPQKNQTSIFKPMSFIHQQRQQSLRTFTPAGQSTQLIVGASSDTDRKIIALSEQLYKNYSLKRVYYSAYIPVNNDPKLPSLSSPPLIREHRLYQADWLLRYYGFRAAEILNEKQPHFDLSLDPKSQWALQNLHLFPVEVNTAPQHMLLRIPGIGVRSVQKIIANRKVHSLTYDNLQKLGVVLKRARYFITCQGNYYGDKQYNEISLKAKLTSSIKSMYSGQWEQLSLFSEPQTLLYLPDSTSSISGEL